MAKETTMPKGSEQEISKEAGKLTPLQKEIPAEGKVELKTFDQFSKMAGEMMMEAEETTFSKGDLPTIDSEATRGYGSAPETNTPKEKPNEINKAAGTLTDETPITPGCCRLQSFAEFSKKASTLVGEAEETKFSKSDLVPIDSESTHGPGSAPETSTPKEKPTEIASEAGKITDETPITPGSHVMSFAEFDKKGDSLKAD